MRVGRAERLSLGVYTRKGRGQCWNIWGKSVYYRAVKCKDLESGQGWPFFETWERLEFSVGRVEASVPLFRKCINAKFIFQLRFSDHRWRFQFIHSLVTCHILLALLSRGRFIWVHSECNKHNVRFLWSRWVKGLVALVERD